MSINTEYFSWEYFVICCCIWEIKRWICCQKYCSSKGHRFVWWAKSCFYSKVDVFWRSGHVLQVQKMGEKLQGLQEEKHQLFLQLKKVLHEEEKRRRKEQRCVRKLCLPEICQLCNFLLQWLIHIYLWIDLSVLIDSDITTLTSASYQPSIPLHSGPHLLSLQGEI